MGVADDGRGQPDPLFKASGKFSDQLTVNLRESAKLNDPIEILFILRFYSFDFSDEVEVFSGS